MGCVSGGETSSSYSDCLFVSREICEKADQTREPLSFQVMNGEIRKRREDEDSLSSLMDFATENPSGVEEG